MNNWLIGWGLAGSKPLFTALLLPPTPLLLLLLLGVRLTKRRPMATRGICGVTALALWLFSCSGMAELLSHSLLKSYAPLSSARIVSLRSQANGTVAIIVLGGGVEDLAPEYGVASLAVASLERLRYGIWLARQTGWPLGFSGGSGWSQSESPAEVAESSTAEAVVAQRIALSEWGLRLRWVESASRDTHENAVNTVKMLSRQGIDRIMLVTHEWHMPRAVRNFETAAGTSVRIDAAPIGLAEKQQMPMLRWIPSGEGLTLTRQVIRERLGLLFGA